MLKRAFFAIAGMPDYSKDPTNYKSVGEAGILDTISIGRDVQATGFSPSVIFTDGHPSAMYSAGVIASVLCPKALVWDPRLTMERNPLRDVFRDARKAHDFLSTAHPLSKDVETVLFMTERGWGLSFGGTWPCSCVSLFDIEEQKFVWSAYHGGGI